MFVFIFMIILTTILAQSAGAVEYTDCTFEEGVRPPSTSVLIWH